MPLAWQLKTNNLPSTHPSFSSVPRQCRVTEGLQRIPECMFVSHFLWLKSVVYMATGPAAEVSVWNDLAWCVSLRPWARSNPLFHSVCNWKWMKQVRRGRSTLTNCTPLCVTPSPSSIFASRLICSSSGLNAASFHPSFHTLSLRFGIFESLMLVSMIVHKAQSCPPMCRSDTRRGQVHRSTKTCSEVTGIFLLFKGHIVQSDGRPVNSALMT